jgi:hypothetical protein
MTQLRISGTTVYHPHRKNVQAGWERHDFVESFGIAATSWWPGICQPKIVSKEGFTPVAAANLSPRCTASRKHEISENKLQNFETFMTL